MLSYRQAEWGGQIRNANIKFGQNHPNGSTVISQTKNPFVLKYIENGSLRQKAYGTESLCFTVLYNFCAKHFLAPNNIHPVSAYIMADERLWNVKQVNKFWISCDRPTYIANPLRNSQFWRLLAKPIWKRNGPHCAGASDTMPPTCPQHEIWTAGTNHFLNFNILIYKQRKNKKF